MSTHVPFRQALVRPHGPRFNDEHEHVVASVDTESSVVEFVAVETGGAVVLVEVADVSVVDRRGKTQSCFPSIEIAFSGG